MDEEHGVGLANSIGLRVEHLKSSKQAHKHIAVQAGARGAGVFALGHFPTGSAVSNGHGHAVSGGYGHGNGPAVGGKGKGKAGVKAGGA